MSDSPPPASVAAPTYFRPWVGFALSITLFGLFLLDIGLGSVAIPPKQVLKILLGVSSDSLAWVNIVEQIRLPKAVTAVLAGAALSVGGLQMQTLFRNPLAGPSVLGITSGASLGVALVTLGTGSTLTTYAIQTIGLSQGWLVVLAATSGAALVLLIILWISFRVGDYVVLLIVGLMVGNITLSLVGIWQYFSRPEQIQNYVLWTLGSLHSVTPHHLPILLSVIGGGIVLSFLSSKGLNALLLGENYATSLGLSLIRARTLIIVATSLLAGAVTGFCGPIGFVGIAVPHLTRSLLNTSDHFVLIPAVSVLGAIIMLFCDIVSQLPGHQATLPINAVTALIGSPVVIWIILRRNSAGQTRGK